jgi:uncharacterized protein YfiM (DUF2279 family)
MRGFVLLFSLHFGGDRSDSWFSADKAKHFFVSAFVETASFSTLRTAGLSRSNALVGASAITAAVGIGKELRDLRRPGGDPSFKDLTWDAAGLLAASALVHHTEP